MNEIYLSGISLKVKSFGEHDQLLYLLNNEAGLVRLIIPGIENRNSPMKSIVPFCFLEVCINEKKSFQKIRQVKILRNFNSLRGNLETLSTAQGIIELCMQLMSEPIVGMQEELMLQLTRLDQLSNHPTRSIEALAIAVQSSVHQLALGGYGLPIQICARTSNPLIPILGNYKWRCSFLPQEGFIIGEINTANSILNSSEFALLQRLTKPILPRSSNGQLMGPEVVWLRLLDIISLWITTYLPYPIHSFAILRNCI